MEIYLLNILKNLGERLKFGNDCPGFKEIKFLENRAADLKFRLKLENLGGLLVQPCFSGSGFSQQQVSRAKPFLHNNQFQDIY
ncbi:MAG: hypothetical protein IPH31_07385 [Lewinellaceae bacterium]|nr:hypothetical protein [Lewinellaceae bacterium]